MLDWETFVEMAKSKVGYETIGYNGNSIPGDLLKSQEMFSVEWKTGGTQGGNCWQSGGHYPVDRQSEPEFEGLYNLLEEIDISFREARQIVALSTSGEYTDNGYYGNYTEYSYKYIPFTSIYDKLVEFGKAQPRESVPTP